MMCGLIETDQWLKKKKLDMVMQQILNYNISLCITAQVKAFQLW